MLGILESWIIELEEKSDILKFAFLLLWKQQ